VLSFTNNQDIVIGGWFRLTFPAGFSFGVTVDCYIMNLNSNLDCTVDGQVLFIRGLKINLNKKASGEYYKIKMKNIINPFAQGTILGFVFESMKPDT